MPKSSGLKADSSNDVVVGNTPKGTFGGDITLHTYSNRTYHIHVLKVLLIVFILVGIAAFIVLGFFYPECNATQDRGFYSCRCKTNSALDLESGLCLCLDTGTIPAINGCPGTSGIRYIYADTRPDEDAKHGGWVSSGALSC
jgi:hypothetical protein